MRAMLAPQQQAMSGITMATGADALGLVVAGEHEVIKEDIGGHGGASEGGDNLADVGSSTTTAMRRHGCGENLWHSNNYSI
jgi:hypothetical protein